MRSCCNPNEMLIEHCLRGDRKSQQQLHDMYCQKMFSVCLRYSRNYMDAEDMLQEGFIRLFSNLHKFRNEGSFEGWVRRIFANTAIEHIRRKNLVTQDTAGIENSVEGKYYSALDSLYEKDFLKKTNGLSSGYKTVFCMYAVEGYSHKEIADTLGISESTSKSQFSRAKAILRNMMRDSVRIQVAAS